MLKRAIGLLSILTLKVLQSKGNDPIELSVTNDDVERPWYHRETVTFACCNLALCNSFLTSQRALLFSINLNSIFSIANPNFVSGCMYRPTLLDNEKIHQQVIGLLSDVMN